MYPIVFFDSVRVVGGAENAVVFKDNNVTFKAISVMPGDYKPVFKFWAFDDMSERIKRLKIKAGDMLTISAFMKERIDENNKVRQSYTILAIDRVHGFSLESVQTPSGGKNDAAIPKVTANHLNNNNMPVPKGFCDLDSFQKQYGK